MEACAAASGVKQRGLHGHFKKRFPPDDAGIASPKKQKGQTEDGSYINAFD